MPCTSTQKGAEAPRKEASAIPRTSLGKSMVTTEWSSTTLPVKRLYAALTSSGIPSKCAARYSGWVPKSMVTPPADSRGSKKRSGNHPRGLAVLGSAPSWETRTRR